MQIPYFRSQYDYWAEHFVDVEHVTYLYCISSKTLANETSDFKTPAL